MADVRIAFDSPIGDFAVVADVVLAKARIAFDPVIGDFLFQATPATVAQIQFDPAIGNYRQTVYVHTDDWSDAGLPCPQVTEYSYERDAGLHRVEMDSGIVRQRRRWKDGYATANIMCRIRQTQIPDVEQFLELYQYQWFTMGLITGDNSVGLPESYIVRVKEDPAFRNFRGMYCNVELTIEMLVPEA